jgi:ABC-type Fe3+-siderophore transport system permease subunit
MNERQQAVFLWNWSRKRQHGRSRVALIGLAVGAAAGLSFAIIMFVAMTMNGAKFSVAEDELAPILLWLSRSLGPTGFLFAVSIPPFALLGAFLADRVWGFSENMYQGLLDDGASVPSADPRQAV